MATDLRVISTPEIWDSQPPCQARASLHTQLHQLLMDPDPDKQTATFIECGCLFYLLIYLTYCAFYQER